MPVSTKPSSKSSSQPPGSRGSKAKKRASRIIKEQEAVDYLLDATQKLLCIAIRLDGEMLPTSQESLDSPSPNPVQERTAGLRAELLQAVEGIRAGYVEIARLELLAPTEGSLVPPGWEAMLELFYFVLDEAGQPQVDQETGNLVPIYWTEAVPAGRGGLGLGG